MRIIELFDDLKIKVYENGIIETLDHTYIRKNGRIDNRKGKFIKPKIDKYGYEVVTFSNKGKRKTYTVHKLVALAFLENTYNKKTINHINGIKTDNRVENLEWATEKENQIHKWKNGLANYKRNNKGQFVGKEVM